MKSEKIALYFKQGTSDKVYHVSMEEAENDSFVVNFAYGRRGSTLTTGTKTKAPVDYASAKKIYDKLVKSKTLKGYAPGEEGPQYVTNADTKDTGIRCQLLNVIEEPQIILLINDKKWWAQEKYDGKRMLIHKTDSIIAINRTGMTIGAPEVILNRAGQVETTYLIDGEIVGEQFFAFDLLEINNTDAKLIAYSQRLSHLDSLGLDAPIIVVETAKTKKQKQQLYDRLKTSGAEGIVFKQHSSPYTAGRPNSGGTQLKFKFYETASVIVTKNNEKRSVAIAVIAEGNLVEVGNVTIPSNKKVPTVNSIIEVRYLYAYKEGSLYQPTYLGVRDDIALEECSISQLKYKRD